MLDPKTRALGGIESVVVVGLGYVGLPLAVAFAEAGLAVFGLEKSAEKVAALRGGDSHVEDVAPERLRPLYEDMQRRLPDIRRVEALLGWRPERTLDDVLDRVISATQQSSVA